jgi:ATP-binding cassette, subfamily B, multidrug efflux pump
MLKILKFLKPYWFLITVLLGLTVVQVLANLALPDYMAKIVNGGIVAENNSVVLNTGLRMLIVSLIGGVATVGAGFLAARVATGYSRNLREKVFSKVESFSLTEFNRFSTASLITRSTNDIQQIQIVLIMLLRMVLSAPITGVGAVIKAYQLAPSMSWIIGLAVAVLFGIIILLFTIAVPKFKLLQKMVDKLNLVTRQNLTGLRVIRAFNNEKVEEKKFDEANQDLTNLNLFVNRLMVVMMPFMMLIFNFTSIGIVWVGAHLISSGNLAIGDMIAFMQYAIQVIMSFLMVSIIFIMIPRASVSAQRVAEVIETEPVIKDPDKPVKTSRKGNGLIEFKNVTFSYPSAETPVLQNVSFTANQGETTAFIGSTGSGKSTLINLIPRFYDVTKGEIAIDGIDIRQMKLEDLYDKIGYVPQKGTLFSGTIESNIKYGAPEADQKEVKKAAKIAQATEFIDQLEKTYDNPIAQGGANVSGGQKQRLSIARAIVRKPEIYIFDDSFSALDFKTDAMLREALRKEIGNKTVLIVGQRVSTIMNADKIIVLDEGKIVGEGTHDQLMKTNHVYREIATSQLSEEELGGKGKAIKIEMTAKEIK